MNSIFHRISVRKYQDRSVDKEKIEQILRFRLAIRQRSALSRTA